MSFFKRKPKYFIITDGNNFAIKGRSGEMYELKEEKWIHYPNAIHEGYWTSDQALIEKFLKRMLAGG